MMPSGFDQFGGGAVHRLQRFPAGFQRKAAGFEIGLEGVEVVLQDHGILRWFKLARNIWLICQQRGIRQIRQHLFGWQMSDRLQELSVFVRAAESGSFSRAARELGLSQPSVSRIIGELEARLGITLLLRTTRRITVTDAGNLFLDRAREILAEIEDAEDAARGLDSLRGIIRLAIPVVYGTREIIPRLPKFLAAHPLLRVEMAVVDERQDLVAEGADVAIRLGELGDSGFGARKLETLQRMLVASPVYLKERGSPKKT